MRGAASTNGAEVPDRPRLPWADCVKATKGRSERINHPSESLREPWVVPDDAPRCAGCGTTDRSLHELTVGIFACDRCIEVTLAVLAHDEDED